MSIYNVLGSEDGCSTTAPDPETLVRSCQEPTFRPRSRSEAVFLYFQVSYRARLSVKHTINRRKKAGREKGHREISSSMKTDDY